MGAVIIAPITCNIRRPSHTCIQNPCSHTRTVAHGTIIYKVVLIVWVRHIHILTLEVARILHIIPSESMTDLVTLHYNVIADAGQCLLNIRGLYTNKVNAF